MDKHLTIKIRQGKIKRMLCCVPKQYASLSFNEVTKLVNHAAIHLNGEVVCGVSIKFGYQFKFFKRVRLTKTNICANNPPNFN